MSVIVFGTILPAPKVILNSAFHKIVNEIISDQCMGLPGNFKGFVCGDHQDFYPAVV